MHHKYVLQICKGDGCTTLREKVRAECVIHGNRTQQNDDTLVAHSRNGIQLMMCLVPKAGSTYIESALHQYLGKSQRLVTMSVTQQDQIMKTYYKAMVVRHPMERLWSGYVNKIVGGVPEFIITTKVPIVQMYHKNASESALTCGDDVTFEDFLKYLVYTANKSIAYVDKHFKPYSYICDPCHIRYDYIAKIEDGRSVLNTLLDNLGIRDALLPQDKEFKSILNAGKRLDFLKWDRSAHPPRTCQTFARFAEYQWNSMVFEGFISPSDDEAYMYMLKMRERFMHNRNLSWWTKFSHELSNYVLNRTCGGNIDSSCLHIISSNKRKVRDKAFQSVPTELLENVLEIYKLDFQLFGYDEYSY